MTFAAKCGPWALVAGASDGVGAAFAEGLAERGVNVVLVARRQAVLDEVSAGITGRSGVETRTLAVDLAEHDERLHGCDGALTGNGDHGVELWRGEVVDISELSRPFRTRKRSKSA